MFDSSVLKRLRSSSCLGVKLELNTKESIDKLDIENQKNKDENDKLKQKIN